MSIRSSFDEAARFSFDVNNERLCELGHDSLAVAAELECLLLVVFGDVDND